MSSTIEEQLASLTKAIEGLEKCAYEQDAKLSKLKNRMDDMIERISSQAPLKLRKIQDKGESCVKQTKIKEINLSAKGNPKQHIAHTIETCYDAGTYGDYSVKELVRSLKEKAFDWYTDLEPNSIDLWEHEFNQIIGGLSGGGGGGGGGGGSDGGFGDGFGFGEGHGLGENDRFGQIVGGLICGVVGGGGGGRG
ncbi:uncharacterized protein LOC125828073 [Solanum verrucosum]|uniref:uncharacterized protein LOC125828073 n=1 Tax=Solanum verrucosum TaxID=315347 RepID=UPI0020D0B4F2|nr:uncharacterized protein LOC125828073 [Solanum verrucosum]